MSESRGTTDARKPTWTGLRRIEARFLRPRRAVLLIALCGLLAQAALNLPVPVLQGQVVEPAGSPMAGRIEAEPPAAPDVTGRPASGASEAAIGRLLAAMIACHVARTALGWKVAATMSRVTLEVVRELTDALHRKLQRLEMTYFDREPTGHIMARLTSDVGSLLIFLNGGSLQLASDLILAAAISGLMLWLQWRLAVVGLLAMPLFVVNHRWFSASIHELSRACGNRSPRCTPCSASGSRASGSSARSPGKTTNSRSSTPVSTRSGPSAGPA